MTQLVGKKTPIDLVPTVLGVLAADAATAAIYNLGRMAENPKSKSQEVFTDPNGHRVCGTGLRMTVKIWHSLIFDPESRISITARACTKKCFSF